ncbi:OsmC family protein [Sandaracinobacter neustonicus]|uniref:OsmC family protein n=1 Tax=Sandaracinobacter neustonicus TaxID=1715348 RepID=A0A501XKL8_9SPHN|nr:OsmC family protein [Sandaracinobacter neustonicus]TPE61096.1 OsmC family protein [Sandaracinobacter neustonicus]
MTDAPTTARLVENGRSPFAVDISVSGHTLLGDEPAEMGGADLGPAPYDLLASALGECTAMTVRWYARQQNWPLEKVEVTLTHQKGGPNSSSSRQDVFTKTILLSGDALTADQRAKLIEIAAKCPVQRTLEGTPLILTAAE